MVVALLAPAAEPEEKVFGLDFGPYTAGPGPGQISARQVRRRLQLVASYTRWVRTFGCGLGLAATGAIAHEFGLSVALGASLSPNMAQNDLELSCLIRHINAGDVDLAIVGSETLLRAELSAATLVAYIDRVKRATAGSGVQVATADTDHELLATPSVIDASDIVLANIYPYFDGVSVTDAISDVASRYRLLQAAATSKRIRISESGWPSCGATIGQALPSPANAAVYFQSFQSWAQSNDVEAYYFEALDEPWKAAYEGAAGACWGIADRHGTLKPGMASVFAAAPAGLAAGTHRGRGPCSTLAGRARRLCRVQTQYGAAVARCDALAAKRPAERATKKACLSNATASHRHALAAIR